MATNNQVHMYTNNTNTTDSNTRSGCMYTDETPPVDLCLGDIWIDSWNNLSSNLLSIALLFSETLPIK